MSPPLPPPENFNHTQGRFLLGEIFRAERRFLLFEDQLAESGRQKTKENIIPHGKLRLVENGLKCRMFVLHHSPKKAQ